MEVESFTSHFKKAFKLDFRLMLKNLFLLFIFYVAMFSICVLIALVMAYAAFSFSLHLSLIIVALSLITYFYLYSVSMFHYLSFFEKFYRKPFSLVFSNLYQEFRELVFSERVYSFAVLWIPVFVLAFLPSFILEVNSIAEEYGYSLLSFDEGLLSSILVLGVSIVSSVLYYFSLFALPSFLVTFFSRSLSIGEGLRKGFALLKKRWLYFLLIFIFNLFVSYGLGAVVVVVVLVLLVFSFVPLIQVVALVIGGVLILLLLLFNLVFLEPFSKYFFLLPLLKNN